MASAQLTDEELFSELKRLGFTPGPVTEHTRPVYLKKLKKLREEQSQQRGSRSGKGRNGGGSINNSNGGGAAARAPGLSARPPSSDVTRRSEKRGAADRPGKFVLGFSSDESDVEAPQKKGGASRRDRGAAIRPAGTSPTAPETPWWADRARSSQSPEDPERDSRVLNGNRAFYEPKPSKFPQDYSDSDEEEDEEESDRERPRERRPLSRHALAAAAASSSPPAPHRGVWSPEKKPLDPASGKMGERNAADDDDDTELGGGGSASRVYPDGVDFGENHIRDDRDSFSSGYSRFALGLRPRFPSYANQPNHGSHAGSNHSHAAAAAPEDELLQQFKRDDEVSSTGGFSAHYLSRILLTTACLFFVLLGLMYLRMRGSGDPQGAAAVIVNHPFGPEFDEQYDTKDRELILNLLFSLHEHLAGVAGSHDCHDSENPLNRSVSFSEAFTHLKLQNEAYENLFETSLEWIMKTKEAVGIRLIGSNPDEAIEDVSDISRLESIHPRMSFLCRFRRAFFTVIHRVLFILAVICAAWGLGYYMKYRWRREEEETRQMYDTVERIIDVMRSHSEACQENKDLQPYLPIPHVRDSLVQPQDRKKMRKVWDRAVRFLSANESRIRTETRRVGGADCTVWRWLQPTSPEKSSSVPSKVWQGKAFPLDRRNSPPNSLTPCLKIRNMFDPVMEVGENWHLAIQEAILEKCSDNDGIVHIAVDKNSREGCVYVKCLSAEHSGKAFKSLHGSWFDGKLVTVKYLRLDRYHQRFPQALGSSTPLKPSSSSMNSMSRLSQRSTSLSFS